MPETNIRRRGSGEDGIYLDTARNRYMGAVSLGFGSDGKRIRRKVSGKTKQEVRDKLKALHQEIDAGIKTSATYTVRDTVDDWLRNGLDDTSDRTRKLYKGLLEPLLEVLGAMLLRDLRTRDVRAALDTLTERYSQRSLQITKNSLERAINHAQADDRVGRNVAALAKTPQGRQGRPSKSFTADQVKTLLVEAAGTRLYAYVVLSLLSGIRTEEARALPWDYVVTWDDDLSGWRPVSWGGFDPEQAEKQLFAIQVWRSDRSGGDTKTNKSRRTLTLPRLCVKVLWLQWQQQERDRLIAGEIWQENGLIFASTIGTPLEAHNVIRAFRIITRKAGLGGDWAPREMRHTFVSVLSAHGVSIEEISPILGHENTVTTDTVYRHEIRPALTGGAEIMDKIFG